MNFLEKRTTCSACLSSKISDVFDYKEMSFSQCIDCRFLFMNPMIDHESIASFYKEYAGTASYTKKEDKKIRRARGRMRRLKRVVPGGVFLDVGCNAGFVVEAARKVGFKAYGIDLSEEAIQYGQTAFPENTFMTLPIEDAAENLPKCDLIYCSEVIEHVLELDSFVEHLSSLMKPGGYLYLTTPDAGDWRCPKDLRHWYGFKPPEHCLYFNIGSLTQCLTRHNIDIKKRYFQSIFSLSRRDEWI